MFLVQQMEKCFFILFLSIYLLGCNTPKQTSQSIKNERSERFIENDTVKITNDDIEYEIIIIEPGFNSWLASRAKPRGFYSQSFLENRNYQYVIEWNNRVAQPQRYNRNLYELQIDYQPHIDYGYEVNYLLYNYFIYFQLTYKQRLGPYVPRI